MVFKDSSFMRGKVRGTILNIHRKFCKNWGETLPFQLLYEDPYIMEHMIPPERRIRNENKSGAFHI